MAKIKFTKNELKKQKDDLKRFARYLPTLELKKKQLQSEINRIKALFKEKLKAEISVKDNIISWSDVFSEEVGFKDIVKLEKVSTETGNIAGVDIPVFKGADVVIGEYDYFTHPLWIDKASGTVKEYLEVKSEREILESQIELLSEELRIITQRVNLFDKIMIPRAKENIRVIKIFLGDEQTAAVVRGKIAKEKLSLRA